MKIATTSLVLASALVAVQAWDKDDHEIFRLRDELEKSEGPGVTFYDFLQITRSAKQIDIDRAFRKRSRALHPDKARQSLIAERASAKPKAKDGAKPGINVNKPPTQREIKAAEKLASERFTRLGLIAEILKDDRRKSYDHFLDNGFPKWRGSGYYYERVRPGVLTTVFGLFVFMGGLLHYAVLGLNYKRHRDFVQRYIRQSRQAAWGANGRAGPGVPGLDNVSLEGAEVPEDQRAVETVNRRERRAKEKESRKKNKDKPAKPNRANGANGSGTITPAEQQGGSGSSTPVPGPKKRVEAENGKILLVDSAGNVFLEEEDEETGELKFLLLDPNEIHKPTFRDTFLWRFSGWIVSDVRGRISGLFKVGHDAAEVKSEIQVDDEEEDTVAATNETEVLEASTTKQRRRKQGRK